MRLPSSLRPLPGRQLHDMRTGNFGWRDTPRVCPHELRSTRLLRSPSRVRATPEGGEGSERTSEGRQVPPRPPRQVLLDLTPPAGPHHNHARHPRVPHAQITSIPLPSVEPPRALAGVAGDDAEDPEHAGGSPELATEAEPGEGLR